jgi:2',3'-cyclic-nucleotide 2'-phosphodiesterase (5'-nucleotidase family)
MPTEMSKGLKFTSGLDEIPEHIKDLKAKGSDIIILLSHNGFPQDVELKKLWIAVLFTVPILIIAMSELLQNNPLEGLLEVEIWNWI